MSRRKQSKPKAVKEDQSEVVQAISQSKDHEDSESPEPKQKRSRERSYTGSSISDSQNGKEKTTEKKNDRKVEHQQDETLSPKPLQSLTESMKCQFCMDTFTSITSLQLHTLKQHVSSIVDERMLLLSSPDLTEMTASTRFLECQHCSAVFPHLGAFALHMRQHLSSDLGSDLLGLSSSHNQGSSDSASASTPVVQSTESVSDVPPCSLCSKPFTDNLTRLSHIITHYEITVKRHLCIECHSVFSTASDLFQHSIDRHLAIQYICTICNNPLDNQKAYQEHCLQHSREAISYKCKACPLSFEAREMLAIHVQYVHDSYREFNPYEQQSFVKRTASILSQQSLSHVASPDYQQQSEKIAERDSRVLQCSVCDERCSGEDALDEHRLFSHCKVLYSDACAECSGPLRTCEDFEHHTRLHVRDMYMSCAVCRQSLRSESQLKLHSKFHMASHQSPILPSFKNSENTEDKRCEICSKTLISNNQLLLHLLEHDDQKCCPYCKMNFNLAHHLLNHISQEHSKEKALYTCEICLEVYHFQIQLDHHKMSHGHDFDNSDSPDSSSQCGSQSGKQPTEMSPRNNKESIRRRCPVCSLTFNKGTRYENHIKKHVNTNCCACQICGENFGRRDELEQHMMVHKGNLEVGSQTPRKSRC